MLTLSILICSLHNRAEKLERLLLELHGQTLGNPVEVLSETDNGEMSIGRKRNILLHRATGEYLAFVDDDDTVSQTYALLILNHIAMYEGEHGENPDCIGMCGHIVRDGEIGWQFRHSITVSRWCKDKANQIYFRTPNHLNPIRRSIAQRIQFPESNWGEDRSYSDQVKPMLKTESFIEQPIYFYQK